MDPALAIELEAKSHLITQDEMMARGDSEVQKFYENSVVLLTGGSGFLGKQLIEKLFRSSNISKLFMLMRPKKGKQIQERLTEILKDPVFDTLRKLKPKFSSNIVVVEGDVEEIRLGIKYGDWETLINEVNVIFHVAATIRFDETLKRATLINIRGTREALILGRACKNLRSYVHVSTAYTHASTDLIGNKVHEDFYEAPVLPEIMISMAETMDADRLSRITKELIKGWPNTYTFTKSISEDLVRTMSTGLPICIVRPGIVMCSYREPTPGWLDFSCMYGASGLFVGSGMGVLHTLRRKCDSKLGLIPCDYVNNAIIVAARETASNQAKGGMDTRIYTVTSTRRNPISFGIMEETTRTYQEKIQTPLSIYYCFGYATSNYWLFMILTFFLHSLPAYIADFVCLLIGKQRRFVKISKKVYNMSNVLSYFLLHEWQFVDENLEKLFGNLSNADQFIYNFDVTNINWTEYTLIQCIGVRRYILKDGLKDTAYGMKKQRIFKIFHYIFTTLFVYAIWKFICTHCY